MGAPPSDDPDSNIFFDQGRLYYYGRSFEKDQSVFVDDRHFGQYGGVITAVNGTEVRDIGGLYLHRLIV